ncbi:hypothetical protein Tco_0393868, partial [Tanacetum coccineum]
YCLKDSFGIKVSIEEKMEGCLCLSWDLKPWSRFYISWSISALRDNSDLSPLSL